MSQLVAPITERDHLDGSRDAPVVLVEYGDFECPYCRRAYPIVKAAQRALADELVFVFRNFPLSEIHAHAMRAAEAAEAAGAEGKFWPMHDMLFEHQTALEDEDLLEYAAILGLDQTRFAREVLNDELLGVVRDDFHGGVRSGVNGTPTFFINGQRYDGDWTDASTFIGVLEQASRLAHT